MNSGTVLTGRLGLTSITTGVRIEQRIAVRGRPHDIFGGDVAASPGAVIDHEILAHPLGQRLADKTRINVGRGAGAEADHQMPPARRSW
jgi:hypothetical protein